MRLFIGLGIPARAPLCRVIDRLSDMGPSVRPVRATHLHITLRFLGDVSPDHLDPIAGAIDSAVEAGLSHGWLGPFDLHLSRLGTFPDRAAAPRVLFACSGDEGLLRRLSQALDAELDALGPAIPPRDHPFNPHVTLARFSRTRRPNRRVRDTLSTMIAEAEVGPGLGSVRIKAVKLIQTRPGTHGPAYTTRHTRALKPAP